MIQGVLARVAITKIPKTIIFTTSKPNIQKIDDKAINDIVNGIKFDIEVKGVEETIRNLREFPERIQKNIMAGAIRAGCKPIVESAKKNVTVDSGNLKRSIGIVKRKTKNKKTMKFSVTPRRGGKNDGYYAHMVEFGTSKMSAKPFMRPALENANKCIDETKKYMEKRIDKVTKDLYEGRGG